MRSLSSVTSGSELFSFPPAFVLLHFLLSLSRERMGQLQTGRNVLCTDPAGQHLSQGSTEVRGWRLPPFAALPSLSRSLLDRCGMLGSCGGQARSFPIT